VATGGRSDALVSACFLVVYCEKSPNSHSEIIYLPTASESSNEPLVAQTISVLLSLSKSKGVPRQAEVALGVPGRLRPWIISTFSTTRVVGRQPYTPAAFTPGEIPATHFQRLSRPQGTWFCRKEPRKKSPVVLPGIDPGTVRLVAQRIIK
jgi:hypothetical protein